MPSLPDSKVHSPLANGSLSSLPHNGFDKASTSSPSDSQLSELKDLPQSESDISGNGKYAFSNTLFKKGLVVQL